MDQVNHTMSETHDTGIKNKTLHNLSARVQHLMNASLTTEEVDKDGTSEAPKQTEEE